MSKVPVTILTGYLGSGKTTFVNYLLKENHGHKFAIIENEFGEVGIDDGLVLQSNEEVIEMMNGCICCTVRGDLVKIVKKLMRRKDKFDAIIIETTGLADPAPVAQTFFMDEEISKACELDGIITVVDAKHIVQHLEEEKPEGAENESVEQVAFADRILLNKIDLVTEDEIADVTAKIREINREVQIVHTQQCNIDPKVLIGIKGFSLDRVLDMDPEFLGEDSEHEHDASVTSISFKFEGDLNLGLLNKWIGELMRTKGVDLFRYKGIIAVCGQEKRFVFQGVHMLFDGNFHSEWAPGETRMSKFVFIGKNLDTEELTTGFERCKAPAELRFAVGDRVEANVGEWKAGTVVALWDEGNPYRIKFDDETEVWGPDDVDELVRKLA